MKRHIMFMLIIMSFLPSLVLAKECDWSEISAKKNLARSINWTYEYYLEDNVMYFDVTAVNIYEDLYVKDLSTDKIYSNNEFTLKKLTDNQKISFEIYSKDCNKLIATKDMSLPAYNSYYGTDYCDGISEFSSCRKWGILSSSITEDVLKKQTDDYRASLLNQKNVEPIKYETNITGFYVFIVLAIIALMMLLIFILHDKREKDFI